MSLQSSQASVSAFTWLYSLASVRLHSHCSILAATKPRNSDQNAATNSVYRQASILCFSIATHLSSLSRIYIYLLQALLNSNLLTHSNSLYKQLWSFKCQCSLAKGITSRLKKYKPMTLSSQLVDKGKSSGVSPLSMINGGFWVDQSCQSNYSNTGLKGIIYVVQTLKNKALEKWRQWSIII